MKQPKVELIRPVGLFIICYLNRRKIAISHKNWPDSRIARVAIINRLFDFLVPTCEDDSLYFKGHIYPAVIFRIPLFMQKHKLEEYLKNVTD